MAKTAKPVHLSSIYVLEDDASFFETNGNRITLSEMQDSLLENNAVNVLGLTDKFSMKKLQVNNVAKMKIDDKFFQIIL